MQYLVYIGEQQHGPYPPESIREYLSAGLLAANDLCWCEGLAGWVPINTISEFQITAPPPPGQRAPPPPPRKAPPPQAVPLQTVTLDLNQAVSVVKSQGLGVRIAPYIFGLLCFFMPFMEVSCRDHALLTMTGTQMVTGTQVTDPMSGKSQPIPGDLFAIITLICVLVAFALSFAAMRMQSIGCAIASGLAILALLILKVRTEEAIAQQAQGLPFIVSFLYGFWLLAISMVVGLIFSALRAKREIKS